MSSRSLAGLPAQMFLNPRTLLSGSGQVPDIALVEVLSNLADTRGVPQYCSVAKTQVPECQSEEHRKVFG